MVSTLAGLGKPLSGAGMRVVTGDLYPVLELCKVWLAIELCGSSDVKQNRLEPAHA